MGEVKVKGHNVSLTSYRLTSLWFHVNWSSHSWNTAFSKFDLENSRSRSQLKVYHPINSYPFRSMSIGPPIPGIQLFQNLTLKIHGQGHGWGQSLKSQHGSNIQSTHIRFVPCQSGIQFLSYDFSKIWPWISRVKSRPWVRSKLKVTTWVQHSIDSHPFRFMWIRHPIPELQHFQNLTLKIKGQRSWVRSQFKVTMWV